MNPKGIVSTGVSMHQPAIHRGPKAKPNTEQLLVLSDLGSGNEPPEPPAEFIEHGLIPMDPKLILNLVDYRGTDPSKAVMFRIPSSHSWRCSLDATVDVMAVPCTKLGELKSEDVVIFRHKNRNRVQIRRYVVRERGICFDHLHRLEPSICVENEDEIYLYYRVLFWCSYPVKI